MQTWYDRSIISHERPMFQVLGVVGIDETLKGFAS